MGRIDKEARMTTKLMNDPLDWRLDRGLSMNCNELSDDFRSAEPTWTDVRIGLVQTITP